MTNFLYGFFIFKTKIGIWINVFYHLKAFSKVTKNIGVKVKIVVY